jgi:hypothetical protein
MELHWYEMEYIGEILLPPLGNVVWFGKLIRLMHISSLRKYTYCKVEVDMLHSKDIAEDQDNGIE